MEVSETGTQASEIGPEASETERREFRFQRVLRRMLSEEGGGDGTLVHTKQHTCLQCKLLLVKSDFSKSQLRKPSGLRLCLMCVKQADVCLAPSKLNAELARTS